MTMLAVMAVLLSGVVCAGEPGLVECPRGTVDGGPIDGTRSYPTVREAALDTGVPLPERAKLVMMIDEPLHQVAVRVEGRIAMILYVEGDPGHWTISSYRGCWTP